MPPSAEWGASKPLLEKDYREGRAKDDMTVDEVIALRPNIYGKVKRANFANNWRAMKARLANKSRDNQPATGGFVAKKTSGPSAWEIAKPLLEEDFFAGKATSSMSPQEVIDLRPGIYGKIPRGNFLTNWRALKKRIEAQQERALKDEERAKNFMKITKLARDLPSEWHGSPAESLLKTDVKNERHVNVNPRILYNSRDEYKEFKYETFRKHVHQYARAELEQPYWMVQKEKKQAKEKTLKEAIKKALQESEVNYELGGMFSKLKIT